MSGVDDVAAWPAPDGGWTISILAREPESGRLGVAIAASSIAVGARCPLLSVGEAVVTSQGFANLKLGPLAIDLLRRGLDAEEVLNALRRHDRWIDYRQIAIIGAAGDIRAHTGAMTGAWAGHRVEGDSVGLGNGLENEEPRGGDGAGLCARNHAADGGAVAGGVEGRCCRKRGHGRHGGRGVQRAAGARAQRPRADRPAGRPRAADTRRGRGRHRRSRQPVQGLRPAGRSLRAPFAVA